MGVYKNRPVCLCFFVPMFLECPDFLSFCPESCAEYCLRVPDISLYCSCFVSRDIGTTDKSPRFPPFFNAKSGRQIRRKTNNKSPLGSRTCIENVPASYTGISGRPESRKKSRGSLPGLLAPWRGPKSPKRVKKESKATLFDSL